MAHAKTWRADIQVLRALAVLLVVLGHAWPAVLPGGFVGVDIFFVISGYLVAGSLLREAAAGRRPDVRDFLARRARRILPAAVAVALVTAVVFAIWLDRLEREEYVRDALAAMLFVANFRAEADVAGYFSVIDPSPFRHYWSLGVEEQFYLLLPLAALLCFRLRLQRSRVLTLVTLVSALSFVGGWWVAQHSAGLAFYMLPPRVWEFGLGAAVALLPALAAVPGRVVPVVSAAIGSVGIVWSLLLLDPTSLVPGPAVVPAVAGTAVLLHAGEGRTWCDTRFWQPARYVGTLSYSLYLTHWAPLAWLLLISDGAPPGLSSTLVALLIAFAAAVVVHVVIERPLHRGGPVIGRAPARRTALSLGSVAVAVGLVALVLPLLSPLASDRSTSTPTAAEVVAGALANPGFVASNVAPPLAESRTLNGLYQGCHGGVEQVLANPCAEGPGTEPTVVVIGDSHAANWYDAFLTAFPDDRVVFVTHTNCPLYDLDPALQTACDQWRSSAVDYVLEERPSLTVLANYTAAYPELEGGTRAEFTSGWLSTLAELDDVPALAVLGDVPAAPLDPPRCLAANIGDARACDFAPARSDAVWNALESEVVTGAGVRWIDTWPWFCERACATLAGNVALWRDDAGHLTPDGSALLSPRLREALPELGR